LLTERWVLPKGGWRMVLSEVVLHSVGSRTWRDARIRTPGGSDGWVDGHELGVVALGHEHPELGVKLLGNGRGIG
jgi:hypothetical protein